jgi:hypothetical protein
MISDQRPKTGRAGTVEALSLEGYNFATATLSPTLLRGTTWPGCLPSKRNSAGIT